MSYNENLDTESFLIISNRGAERNESLTGVVNRHSGLSTDCFALVAHDAAIRHGFSLHAVTDEGEALIFRGSSSNMKLVERDIGPRFFTAAVDGETASSYLLASESAVFDPSFSAGQEEPCIVFDAYKPHLDA